MFSEAKTVHQTEFFNGPVLLQKVDEVREHLALPQGIVVQVQLLESLVASQLLAQHLQCLRSNVVSIQIKRFESEGNHSGIIVGTDQLPYYLEACSFNFIVRDVE